ncbi:hypothetical protein C0J52_00158 [Blattella germanica]|nr:hypothetical protein C0J52_00158 [Blattella germanica]
MIQCGMGTSNWKMMNLHSVEAIDSGRGNGSERLCCSYPRISQIIIVSQNVVWGPQIGKMMNLHSVEAMDSGRATGSERLCCSYPRISQIIIVSQSHYFEQRGRGLIDFHWPNVSSTYTVVLSRATGYDANARSSPPPAILPMAYKNHQRADSRTFSSHPPTRTCLVLMLDTCVQVMQYMDVKVCWSRADISSGKISLMCLNYAVSVTDHSTSFATHATDAYPYFVRLKEKFKLIK